MKPQYNSVRPSGRRNILAGSAALVALAAVPQLALAQEAESNEVVVTGTSIRGVAPVGSQLIGVTRETITADSPANAKELLMTVPQLGNFGANAEQSTSNRFRTAGFQPNIHNLGIYATLTLFNGHRMAPVGGEAVFPDPSIIPVIATQRVEVIADGASAIYGSDAVAGVVNFIYRTKVDGFEASATYGWNDTSYRKRNAAVLGGKVWDNGSIMAAYEYSDNTSPKSGEIDFLALGGDQTSRGGRDLRGTVCLDPTVRAANALGNPTGTTYQYVAPGTSWPTSAARCGNLNPNSNIVPDGKRHAFLFTGDYNITDAVRLWSEVNYSYYDTVSEGGRQTLNLLIPNTNPYFRAPPALSSATRVAVTRSGLGLFDPVIQTQYSEVAGITLGADIDLGGDWLGNVFVHASRTRDFNASPELDLLALQAAAAGTTTATALNPYGQAAQNNAAVLASINNGFSQDNKTSQRLREMQIKADGPLFSIAGGDIRAAIGANFRIDQAKQLQTAGSINSRYFQVVRDDDINRSIAAAFGELNIPLVSAQNAMPGIQALTLSVSGRYDYYEAYGGKLNPKYGVVYSPIEGLNLRGSYGTNFAAPNAGLITSIFGVPQPSQNYNFVIAAGPYAGQTLGTGVRVYNLGGGNPDLEPEEAETFSLGAEFRPTFLPGFRLGIGYYDVEYTNLIYKPTAQDVITNPAFIDSRVIFPTQAQIDAAIAFAPPQQPITTTYDVLFNSYAINIGARQIGGVDIEGGYQFDTQFGSFNLGVNANRQTKWQEEVVPGSGFRSRLGTSDAPEWKTRYTGQWRMDPVSVTLSANYTGEFKNVGVTPNQTVDPWLTFDLSASYDFANVLKGTTVQFRAQNLTNEDPPFYDAANGYFPALASPFGRTFEVSLRTKF